jgi:ADP-ribose pyrophosphatase YjhB (NUDIX family)
MLNKWLVPNSPSKIPCYSSHNLAVGGVVLSPCKTKMLVIKENFSRLMHLWKFPGGLVDEGETIEQAATREVWEETGIKASFLGVIGFREQLNFRFGQGDLYFMCLMQAETSDIKKQDEEIMDAKWMPIAEAKNEEFYAMSGEVARHIS